MGSLPERGHDDRDQKGAGTGVNGFENSVAAGRFDVHSHVIPGIDDGSGSMEETLRCARRMVQAGYTHSFCTPHIWPSNLRITVESIPRWTSELQARLDEENIQLKIYPGGEINLRPDLMKTPLK